MPNKPVRVYILSTDHLGILFIATSKKKAYDFLQESDQLRLVSVHSYWSFAQLTKDQVHVKFESVSGVIIFEKYNVNEPLKPPSLFT